MMQGTCYALVANAGNSCGTRMDESEIQDFWNRYPCGDLQVGGLERHRGDYESFFSNYDRSRYRKESHILKRLDGIDFKGQRVLEIGLGQGADSEQLIRRGAIWSGLDITSESVDRVRKRLTLRDLPHKSVKQGSVLDIPFEDGSFDIVFSHGFASCPRHSERATRDSSRIEARRRVGRHALCEVVTQLFVFNLRRATIGTSRASSSESRSWRDLQPAFG